MIATVRRRTYPRCVYLVELLGGPFDGEILTKSNRLDPFVWIDAGGLCHGAPGEGRDLYRFSGTTRAVTGGSLLRYRYAALELVKCPECGWFGPRSPCCILCSGQLAA